ncbi:MAG: atsA 19 [Verrucomicrobiaceae bacterium]|nr:atsA 19 [Verrucomicrobiaceae bacterium]
MNRFSHALSCCFLLPLCTLAADEPVPAAPFAADSKAETSPGTPKDAAMSLFDKDPVVVSSNADLGAFGSDDPVERPDLPARGVIILPPPAGGYTNMDHWHQYDWTVKARRWGHYQVRLTYRLDHATLGVQLKHGDTRLKKTLLAAPSSRRAYIGEVFFSEATDQVLGLYTPPSDVGAGFEIKELALIPSNEGEPVVKQAADGQITLLAKDATTWSENMRYEPKTEKNCLGYWTDAADFAEWEFEVTKPGKYQIVVTHGCGKGNGGSEVAVKVGSQETRFKVEETGGFQTWKDVVIGEIELKTAGSQRLVVNPVSKAKAAVMDVQKVLLKPVS